MKFQIQSTFDWLFSSSFCRVFISDASFCSRVASFLANCLVNWAVSLCVTSNSKKRYVVSTRQNLRNCYLLWWMNVMLLMLKITRQRMSVLIWQKMLGSLNMQMRSSNVKDLKWMKKTLTLCEDLDMLKETLSMREKVFNTNHWKMESECLKLKNRIESLVCENNQLCEKLKKAESDLAENRRWNSSSEASA